jgi:tRNA pseudouridine38-40 synthase
VQAELEDALAKILRQQIQLTGSSRTDAGVHALQNYFHFDIEGTVQEKLTYNLNAVLPKDLAVNRLVKTGDQAHCRFDALSRQYRYHIHRRKQPFLQDRSYYFPYQLDLDLMNSAAAILLQTKDFSSFSKRHTQVNNFICTLVESRWQSQADGFSYLVRGNRFLRGMVRGLTGTMLKVGRGKLSLLQLQEIIAAKDCSGADFAVPAAGLFLEQVNFADGYFGSDEFNSIADARG